jgi:hypothetical protein
MIEETEARRRRGAGVINQRAVNVKENHRMFSQPQPYPSIRIPRRSLTVL